MKGKTGFSGPKKSIPITHQMANLTVFPIPIYFQNSVSEKSKKIVHLMPMKMSLQTSVSEKKNKNIWLKAAPMIAAVRPVTAKDQAVLQRGWKHQIRGILEQRPAGNLRLPIHPLVMSK